MVGAAKTEPFRSPSPVLQTAYTYRSVAGQHKQQQLEQAGHQQAEIFQLGVMQGGLR
jgi:hypothetical protein